MTPERLWRLSSALRAWSTVERNAAMSEAEGWSSALRFARYQMEARKLIPNRIEAAVAAGTW